MWNEIRTCVLSARHGRTLGRLLGWAWLFCLCALALVAPKASQAHESVYYSGNCPPIAYSIGILSLSLSDHTIRWRSSDDVLKEVDTHTFVPTTWNYVAGNPARLVFQGQGNGITLYGDCLFAPYNRAVIDVIKNNRRIRYVVTTIPLQVAWVDAQFHEPDFLFFPPASDTRPFEHRPNEPGGQGGFGGPPPGSGFVSLADPYTIQNLNVSDEGNLVPATMTLTLESNVSGFVQGYLLKETAPDSNLFVDADDSLAIQALQYSRHQPGLIDTMQIFVVSMAFGSRRSLTVYETGGDTNVFASEHLALEVTMAHLPDPGVADTLSVKLTSNLKPDVANADLTETGPNTLVFQSADGSLSLRLARITSNGGAKPDDFTAFVTSSLLNVQEAEVDALETGANTLIFQTAALHNSGAPGSGPGALKGVAADARWEPALKIPADRPWPFGDSGLEAEVRRRRGATLSAPERVYTIKWLESEAVTRGNFRYYPLHKGDGSRVFFLLRQDTDSGDIFIGDSGNIGARSKDGDGYDVNPKEEATPHDEKRVIDPSISGDVNRDGKVTAEDEPGKTTQGLIVIRDKEDVYTDKTEPARRREIVVRSATGKKVRVSRSSDKLNLYDKQTDGKELFNAVNEILLDPGSYWLQGGAEASNAVRDQSLKVRPDVDASTATDEIKVTVLWVDIDADISGSVKDGEVYDRHKNFVDTNGNDKLGVKRLPAESFLVKEFGGTEWFANGAIQIVGSILPADLDKNKAFDTKITSGFTPEETEPPNEKYVPRKADFGFIFRRTIDAKRYVNGQPKPVLAQEQEPDDSARDFQDPDPDIEQNKRLIVDTDGPSTFVRPDKAFAHLRANVLQHVVFNYEKAKPERCSTKFKWALSLDIVTGYIGADQNGKPIFKALFIREPPNTGEKTNRVFKGVHLPNLDLNIDMATLDSATNVDGGDTVKRGQVSGVKVTGNNLIGDFLLVQLDADGKPMLDEHGQAKAGATVILSDLVLAEEEDKDTHFSKPTHIMMRCNIPATAPTGQYGVVVRRGEKVSNPAKIKVGQ